MNNQVKLTGAEKVELSYLRLKGFRYLVRNEIGSVKVFVNKPHRDKETNYAPYGKTRGGYDHWIETKTPISIEEQQRCRGVELGKYEFIKWEDEPMLIQTLIDTPPVPTIKPEGKPKQSCPRCGNTGVHYCRSKQYQCYSCGQESSPIDWNSETAIYLGEVMHFINLDGEDGDLFVCPKCGEEQPRHVIGEVVE